MFLNREEKNTLEVENHESTFLAHVWANNLTDSTVDFDSAWVSSTRKLLKK